MLYEVITTARTAPPEGKIFAPSVAVTTCLTPRRPLQMGKTGVRREVAPGHHGRETFMADAAIHGQDHHDKRGFFTRWFMSTNHKDIGA